MQEVVFVVSVKLLFVDQQHSSSRLRDEQQNYSCIKFILTIIKTLFFFRENSGWLKYDSIKEMFLFFFNAETKPLVNKDEIM